MKPPAAWRINLTTDEIARLVEIEAEMERHRARIHELKLYRQRLSDTSRQRERKSYRRKMQEGT